MKKKAHGLFMGISTYAAGFAFSDIIYFSGTGSVASSGKIII